MTSKQRDASANWEWVTLETIADINPKLPYELEDEVDVSFIPMKRVEEETGRVDLSESRKYGNVKKGYTKFINNDIIFAKITPCMENGKVAILKGLENGVGFGSTEFHVIRMKDESLSRKFYFYFFLQKGFRNLAAQNFTGTVGQRRVPTDFMKEVLVPLPPYNEQVGIVGRVEELFSRLDVGVRSLQAAQTQLEQYQQTTLKQAYTGKLTQKWRQEKFSQLSNVSDLLSSIREKRKKIMEKRKLIIQPIEEKLELIPKEWKWVRAQDVCENITNGYTPKKDKLYEKGDIPFIKIYNMKKNGYVNFNERPTFIDLETHNNELKRSKIYPNDILMNIVGPPLGKVSIVPADYPEWNINQAIVFYRPIEGYNLKFLFYCLQSEFILMHLRKQAKATAGQYNISVTMSRNLPIPLAPIEEQVEISKRLEKIFSYVSRIESNIQKNIEMADGFRSSILKKAFEGRLIPQDSCDKPASIFLEHIKAQKGKQGKLK